MEQVAHHVDGLDRFRGGEAGQRTGSGMQQRHVFRPNAAQSTLGLDFQAVRPGFLDAGLTALVEYEPACGQFTHSRSSVLFVQSCTRPCRLSTAALPGGPR